MAHDHYTGPGREPEPDTGWTGYALIKYGFILVITIVILYFVARYLIPLFR
jgi:hypothetical protein